MYSYLIRANRRYYQQHRWQIALLLFGIMLGVAVVVAIDLVNDSAQANFKLANERLQGTATHHIIGDTPLPETLYVDLKKQFEVIAAPLINSYAKDSKGLGLLFQVIGIDPLMERHFHSEVGTFLDGKDFRVDDFMGSRNNIVLDRSSAQQLQLKVEDHLTVKTNQGLFQLRVLSLMSNASDPRLQQLIIADIGLAQQLAGLTGKLSHIALQITDEQQLLAISRWLPSGIRIETPSSQQQAAKQLTAAFQLNLSMLSLLALAVGLFLVYNTVAFSLLQRMPMLAQFRTLGLSVGHIRNYLLLEYATFSVLGTLLGCLLGVMLAYGLINLVTQTLSDLYIITPISQLWITPLSIAKGLLVGIIGCLIACWLPYHRAANAPPIRHQQRLEQEAAVRRHNPVRGYISLFLILLAATLSTWSESGLLGGYLAIACLLLSMALITPNLIVAACQMLGRLLNHPVGQRHYPILLMAIRDTDRNLSRTGIASMALMVAIACAVGMSVMIDSFRNSVVGWLEQRLNADLYLTRAYETPDYPRELPIALLDALRHSPELTAFSTFRYGKTEASKRPLINGGGRNPARRITVIGAQLPIEGEAAYQFLTGDPAVIWRQWRSPGAVIISESLANHLGVARHNRIHLRAGQQSMSFKVVGIYYDYGSDSGRALLTNQPFEHLWPSIPVSQVGLYLRDPAQQATLIARLQKHWGHSLSLHFTTAREILALSLTIFERTFTITDVLRLLAMIVAFSGVLSAFMGIQLERDRELRVLNALGFNRRELIVLLLLQALLLGALTGLLAVPVGTALAWLLTEVINLRAFGWSIPLQLSGNIGVHALLLALTASLMASIYPAWKLSRPGKNHKNLATAE